MRLLNLIGSGACFVTAAISMIWGKDYSKASAFFSFATYLLVLTNFRVKE